MTALSVQNLAKTFTMHLRDGVVLPVVDNVNFDVNPGECVVLGGPSGAGKSSILKMVYGNYGVDAGAIVLQHHGKAVDLATADPRTVLTLRRDSIGYVSQFLRTVPRVSALDVVAEPLVIRGIDRWVVSTCPNGCGPCRRPPSRVASSNASTLPAASLPITRCCCSTSPPPRSTPPIARWWWR